MYFVRGETSDILARLFHREGDGRVLFGPAVSRESLTDLDQLDDWTAFSDHIMERGVRYSLRVKRQELGLVLEVRVPDETRTQDVLWFVKEYVRWAGLEALSRAEGDAPGTDDL